MTIKAKKVATAQKSHTRKKVIVMSDTIDDEVFICRYKHTPICILHPSPIHYSA